MQSYKSARTLFSIAGFFMACLIMLGVIIAIGGFVMSGGASVEGFISIGVGGTLAVFGFVTGAFIESARASVDTAEYTQQALQVSREQLAISRELLTLAKLPNAGSAFQTDQSNGGLKAVSIDTETVDTPIALPADPAKTAPTVSKEDQPQLNQSAGYELGKMLTGGKTQTAADITAPAKDLVPAEKQS